MSASQVADTRPLRHWLHGAGRPHLAICCVEHPDPGAWSRAAATPAPPQSGVEGFALAGSGRAKATQAVVRLSTCAAELSPAVLLELVAGGASGITVALDGCAKPADCKSVVARAGAFLSALHRPETINAVRTLPPERKRGRAWPIVGVNDVPVSRRTLLGRPDGLDLAEPSDHPTERLAAALRELAGGDGSGTGLDGIPTGIPRLAASGCAGSGVCVRSCPVDSLTLTRTVLAQASPDRDAIVQFQLTFDPSRCTDCGQCQQVCPESALKRSGEYLWSSLLVQEEPDSLRVGLVRRCARCGGPHGRLGNLCAVCAYRAANPFGSTMPPGLPPP
jgi:ferredoxin